MLTKTPERLFCVCFIACRPAISVNSHWGGHGRGEFISLLWAWWWDGQSIASPEPQLQTAHQCPGKGPCVCWFAGSMPHYQIVFSILLSQPGRSRQFSLIWHKIFTAVFQRVEQKLQRHRVNVCYQRCEWRKIFPARVWWVSRVQGLLKGHNLEEPVIQILPPNVLLCWNFFIVLPSYSLQDANIRRQAG